MNELTQIRLFGALQITVSGTVLICLLILIVGILKSRQTRSQPFNAYVISLELSDACMNIVFFVSSVWYVTTAGDDTVNPKTVKKFWDIIKTILIFTAASNMWMNGFVGYHIFTQLKNSRLARRIDPPTIQRVVIETLLVYIIAGIMSYVFYWLITHGHMVGIQYIVIFGPLVPMVYICYITIRIWYQKLLPITGRTRTIAIYFGRIVFVFFAFYLPGSIFFATGTATKTNWCRNIGILIFALQAGFSFLVALKKPDIYDAVVIKFLRCKQSDDNNVKRNWFFRKKKNTTAATNSNNNNGSNDITDRQTTTAHATSYTDTRTSDPITFKIIEESVTINDNDGDDDIEAVVESKPNYSSLDAMSLPVPSPCNRNKVIDGDQEGEDDDQSPSQRKQQTSTTSTTTKSISYHPSLRRSHDPDIGEDDEKWRQSRLPPPRRSVSPPPSRDEDQKHRSQTKRKTKTKTKAKTKPSEKIPVESYTTS